MRIIPTESELDEINKAYTPNILFYTCDYIYWLPAKKLNKFVYQLKNIVASIEPLKQ